MELAIFSQALCLFGLNMLDVVGEEVPGWQVEWEAEGSAGWGEGV